MAQDIAVLGIEVRTSGVQQANRELQTLTQQGGKAEGAAQRLGTRMSALKTIFAGVGFAALARQTIQAADAMTNMESRLRLVTKSSQELAFAQQKLFENSQKSQTALQGNADLYVSLARATQELGVNQETLLSVTDRISKSFIISGAGAASQRAALVQLNQALQSGVLRGEEFNSVNEQAPRLMQALAEGLGVARSELRGLAEAGELTTDKVFPALVRGLKSIDKEFDTLTPTVGRATTALGNAFLKVVNDANKTTGATNTIAASITGLANNLETVATVIGFGVAAALGRYVGALATSTAATFTDIVAKQRSLAAEVAYQTGLARTAGLQAQAALGSTALAAARTREAAATTAAAAAQARMASGAALARGALGLLGGPLGAITTALAIGAAAWINWGNKAAEATAKVSAEVAAALQRAKQIEQEAQFGSGDVGTLRAGLDDIDKKIAAAEARLQNVGGNTPKQRAANRYIITREVKATIDELVLQRIELEGALGKVFNTLREADGGQAATVGKAYNEFLSDRRSNSQKLKDDLAAEQAAFKQATAGLKQDSAEYIEAFEAYNRGVEDIRKKYAPKSSGRTGSTGRVATPKVDPVAEAFKQSMVALSAAQRDAEKSTLDLTAAEGVLYDLMRSPEWERFPETWREAARAQTEAAKAAEVAAEAERKRNAVMEEGRQIIIDQRTPVEVLGATVARLNELLAQGAIDFETYSRAVFEAQDGFDGLAKKAEETDTVMSEFAKNFARSTQSTLSDFLFSGFDEGLDGIVKSFGQTLKRLIADAIAADLMNRIFGPEFGKTGKMGGGQMGGGPGGWFGAAMSFAGTLFSAQGNAFSDSGAVQAFASGGAFGNGEILTQPTAFRFASGGAFRNGIAGEAGPEGALPLKRMSNGKLGVHMEGGGGGNVTINQNFYGKADTSAVKRAAGAGAREALGAMEGARRYG